MASSTAVKRYTGDFSGGLPNIPNAGLYDVAIDVCSSKFWQFDGIKWVSVALVTGIKFTVGSGITLAEKISNTTGLPAGVTLYSGNSTDIPVEMQGSDQDLVINHNLGVIPAFISGNYNMTADDSNTERIHIWPTSDNCYSKSDGYWTVWKKFNCAVSNGSAEITLLALRTEQGGDPGSGGDVPPGTYLTMDDILQGKENKFLSASELAYLQYLQERIFQVEEDRTVLKDPIYVRVYDPDTGEYKDIKFTGTAISQIPEIDSFAFVSDTGNIFEVGEDAGASGQMQFSYTKKYPDALDTASGALYLTGRDEPLAMNLDLSGDMINVALMDIEPPIDLKQMVPASMSFYLSYKDKAGERYQTNETVLYWSYPLYVQVDANTGTQPSDASITDGSYVNSNGSAFNGDYIKATFKKVLTANITDSLFATIPANGRRVMYAVPSTTPLQLLRMYGIEINFLSMMAAGTVTITSDYDVELPTYTAYVYQSLVDLEEGIWTADREGTYNEQLPPPVGGGSIVTAIQKIPEYNIDLPEFVQEFGNGWRLDSTVNMLTFAMQVYNIQKIVVRAVSVNSSISGNVVIIPVVNDVSQDKVVIPVGTEYAVIDIVFPSPVTGKLQLRRSYDDPEDTLKDVGTVAMFISNFWSVPADE